MCIYKYKYMLTQNISEKQKKPLTVTAFGEDDWGNGVREHFQCVIFCIILMFTILCMHYFN